MFFSINDVLSAWDSLSENVMNITAVNSKLTGGASTVDHSYITPTIIALGGDFQESKLDELIQITQGDPVVIWNLGYNIIKLNRNSEKLKDIFLSEKT